MMMLKLITMIQINEMRKRFLQFYEPVGPELQCYSVLMDWRSFWWQFKFKRLR